MKTDSAVDVLDATPSAEGFSDESVYLQERFAEVRNARDISRYWSATLDEALDNLALLKQECAEPGWDGYGAQPVNEETLERVVAFLRALPENVPVPDLVPEPDGEVSVEWQNGPRRVFSVSIGPHGRLSYAGLLGASRWHGVDLFFGAVPPEIIRGIARVSQ
jgi:hypothetical protein